ncbi:MAG: helix-turn-helix domain-containing protein [Clostridia bacterium]|nr:helix-turn-helix domain-containing protein [Clostridia bacterium]
MDCVSLKELIDFLEYGTNLHIGVLFFGSYGNEKCALENDRKIHSGKLCEKFKTNGKQGFKRCLRCRNLALKKALSQKEDFGGLCINGIYEYTKPVIIDGEVACVIYIGNILTDDGREKIEKNLKSSDFENLVESGFDYEKCRTLALVIEGHIRTLLEKYSNEEKSTNSLIENIKSYIKSNLESELEIGSVAKIFHFNPKYLGRLFKKETNTSISEYICTKRLERAAKLLGTSGESVLNISYSVGFKNVTYFNRVFKIKYGVSPKEYRKSSEF